MTLGIVNLLNISCVKEYEVVSSAGFNLHLHNN